MYPSTGGRLRAVTELWRLAEDRVSEFDAIAVDYKRYRPRYPERLFDDIVDVIQEEADAEMKALGGVSEQEELSDPVWSTTNEWPSKTSSS